MGRPLRYLEPELIYFVTARCIQRRFLLRPSRRTKDISGGVLARAARLFEVELFAFNFLSTHFHIIVRAPRGNLSRFMQYVMGNLSKKVGAVVGWKGAFWERRFSAEPILDEDALRERVGYVLSHGVKEGLVRHCHQWPGLSSLSMMLDGSGRRYPWYDWTRRAKQNRGGASQFAGSSVELEVLCLTALPIPALADPKTRRRFVRRLVRDIEEKAASVHRTFAGVRAVLAVDPQDRAPPVPRRRRPWCHTSSPELRASYLEEYRCFAAEFRAASARWRRGDAAARFPDLVVKPFVWPTDSVLAA